ncbi:MAG: DUF4363 family protein [Clostridia bacterium]|nr:DUF4363 family protein [Clostridia bacterium]
MKGFLTALIIMLVLLFLLFIYSGYVENTFSSLSRHIGEIEVAIKSESFEKALFLAKQLREKLKEKAGILYFVTDRALIDEAFTECEKLLSFIISEDKAEALASASGIRVMIEKTEEKSTIRFP